MLFLVQEEVILPSKTNIYSSAIETHPKSFISALIIHRHVK
jgi:hypothetical protein